MNIIFPTATADNQIFKSGDLSWTWNQIKNRWDVTPIVYQTIFPINSGGTNSSTASGARINLEFTKENYGIKFGTIYDSLSSTANEFFISPNILRQVIMTPAFEYLPSSSFAATNSGTGASGIASFWGCQMNFPTTRGYIARTLGGTNISTMNANNGGINWSKTVIITGRVSLGTSNSFPNNDQTFRFILGGSSTDILAGDWGDNQYGIGWRVTNYGPFVLVTQNGPISSYSALSSNIFFATGISFSFMLVSRNGKVDFYLNNTFVLSSDNGPTFTDASARIKILAESPSLTSVVNYAFFIGVNLYAE